MRGLPFIFYIASYTRKMLQLIKLNLWLFPMKTLLKHATVININKLHKMKIQCHIYE